MLIATFYFGDLETLRLSRMLAYEMGYTPSYDVNKLTMTVLFTKKEKLNFAFIKNYTFPIKVETLG